MELSHSSRARTQGPASRSARGRSAQGLAGRARGNEGFSLIELLVVMIVIGVLAAIAIPSFLSSRARAYDAQAKALARTAETTAEVLATDHDGSYEYVTLPELAREEPAITTAPTAGSAYLLRTTHSGNEYSVTVKSTNGDELTISRDSAGQVTRSCHTEWKTNCGGGESSTW